MSMFRLNFGMHIEDDGKSGDKMYKQGEIFESRLNLLALNGPPGMSPKFDIIQQAYAPSTPPQPFVPTQRSTEPLIDMSDKALLEELKRRGLGGEAIGHAPIKVDETPKHSQPIPAAVLAKYPSLAGKAAPKTRAELVQLLNSLTLKELHGVAEDEEFTIPADAKTKDAVIRALLPQFDAE